ncbi:beta-ketoacyl synthase chain length factor [Otariodibacter sp.]|uniref:beta-ketoacyl synthase chain length factor n=1 Tax=Otariodibacter sp. TaxID=3030919 RepID=UPI00260B85BD|nr:beta-ketoacyl synthase chain length factor [Otariodibacter sp.]
MDNLICHFSFNISQWNVVCNKALSAEDWKLGANHWFAISDSLEDIKPKLAFLPPLKRRRLSDSARLFFEAAWELTDNESNLPVVYASLNSEINRSFALWKSLLSDGDVSPTSFSLSVHNALVGQWSEMRQVKNETTAITATKDNLEIAIMEAYCLLNEGHEKVLVVIVENPLSQDINVHPVTRHPFAYALAMIIEKGNDYQLSLYSDSNTRFDHLDFSDNALTWIKNSHLEQNHWQTPNSRGGYWQWQKN